MRYRERHELRQKQKRERKYAQRAKEAKGYYGVPSAKHSVLVALVEWKKGEKCRPFDRRHYWIERLNADIYAKMAENMTHQIDTFTNSQMYGGGVQSMGRALRAGNAVHQEIEAIDYKTMEDRMRRVMERTQELAAALPDAARALPRR